ncbi:sensor histidine kinase [Neorhodopirellula pilleata]|uniref:histidine kinase n=1 Tax=Neorhodopirellula pilleata TaxID=2714738 RepID=A0A5C6AAM6_9BACT|nr:ATP-binding protein [Neorhodopirellula pilleata]TWT96368.1 Wide host range VirA protein [Neorhodopirellula pilleata]
MPDTHPITPPDAQTQITALKNQVRHMQSLASLGELTGTATHEFNNVLMTVINYAKLGLRNQDAESRDKALTRILAASERAAKITNTILAQARNRTDAKEPTDLVALINDTMILLQREMQKYRISVDTELAAGLPLVPVSGNQIQRLLLNLMTNARQAMGEGGSLLIRLAPVFDASGQTVSVELTVRDSGTGIPADVLPRIFDPFFSTKSGPDESGKGGTGLGLAACKEIVDEHDGKIRVESSVGRGTAFIIRLPIQSQQQAAA